MTATVDCEWVLREKSNGKVKILDATYAMKPLMPHDEFKQKLYGKFDELMKEQGSHPEFLAERIPDSAHFDFNVAYHPGEFEKFSLYPPEVFQEYIRRLGIDEGDHVVVYARGPGAGMVFAARAWWTLKFYGHDKVSVLNGGYAAWKSAGHPTVSGPATMKIGTWTAKPVNESIYISFHELSTKDAEGESLFDKAEKLNFLDARPKEQFTGAAALGHDAKHATGSHLRGSKNIPVAELVCPNGLRPKEHIQNVLSSVDYQPGQETIVQCNSGVQASVLALALHELGIPAKLYNGSMTELAKRASHVINGSVNKE